MLGAQLCKQLRMVINSDLNELFDIFAPNYECFTNPTDWLDDQYKGITPVRYTTF